MFTNSIYVSEPSSYDPINFPIETNLHSQFRCKMYLSLEYYKSGLAHQVIPYEYFRGTCIQGKGPYKYTYPILFYYFFKGGRNEMREPFKCNIKSFVSQDKYTSSDQGTLLVRVSLHFLFLADWSHTQWALLLLQLICIQVQHVHIQRYFSEYVGCNNCLSYCCRPAWVFSSGINKWK